jgi:SAM-dependent methyltransferase
MADQEGMVDHYGASYGGFARDVYAEVRREAWGEEIGQNSWLTRDELERFIGRLQLDGSSRVLEIGCGSGGPALHLARLIGCEIVGVDLHEDGVANATRMAREAGLDARVSFVRADASEALPFASGSFGALLCVDTVNHLRDRARVFDEWARLLAPGGRVLFTDPITVTGPLSSDEIAIRASIGYFVFVPVGEDERLLRKAGFGRSGSRTQRRTWPPWRSAGSPRAPNAPGRFERSRDSRRLTDSSGSWTSRPA